MGFTEAVSSGFRQYVGFAGRASRSEYWYWVLFVTIVAIIAAVIDVIVFPGSEIRPLNTITSLALLLPGLAVAARRLHDLNQRGWWLLMFPFVWGAFFWKGTEGPNRFGPDPLAGQQI
jgi:uncharacterized membrane protein YhaH (DUF805 family)